MMDDILNPEVRCGFGRFFRPEWLQHFNNNKFYLVVHCFLALFQAMMFTYMSGILSTLEKVFGIRSEYSAYVMSGNELSQFLLILFLPCLNRVKSRPLWVGRGMLLSVVGCLFISLAALTTTDLATGNNALISENNFNVQGQICININETHGHLGNNFKNRQANVLGIAFIFLGLFLAGFGNTVYFSLSVSYLDDNVSRQFSPVVLSISLLVRIIGPFLGIGLSAICLKVFVNPSQRPGFNEDDPRWIGAWWMGLPIIALFTLLFSLIVMLFPQRLPILDSSYTTDASNKAKRMASKAESGKKLRERRTSTGVVLDKAEHSWQHTKLALKRLLSNKIYVLNLVSICVTVFGFSGFGTFLPKFYQIWFRFRASNTGAAMVGHIIGQTGGLLIAAYVLFKHRPKATTVCTWNVLSSLFLVCGLFGISFTACKRAPWIMHREILEKCVEDCQCEKNDYNPICIEELGVNFHSACTAGCKSFRLGDDDGLVTYEGCECLRQQINNTFGLSLGHPLLHQSLGSFTAVKGECYSDDNSCYNSFYIFSAIVMFISFFIASGRIGMLLVQLRAIKVEDKNIAMAIMSALTALFGQLPGPLVYGYLYDVSCTLFRQQDDEGGDCLQYDTESISNWVVRFTCVIGFISFCIDVAIVFIVRKLDLYVEPTDLLPVKEQLPSDEEETSV